MKGGGGGGLLRPNSIYFSAKVCTSRAANGRNLAGLYGLHEILLTHDI